MTRFRARVDGPVSAAWRQALRDVGADFVEDDSWDLVLPPMGKGSRSAVEALRPADRRLVGVLRGADALASKRALWACVRNAYGSAGARALVPETFLLDDADDHRRFAASHHEGQRWVLKHPHRQARAGVRLIERPSQARAGIEEGWVVVQRYVPDVLTRAQHRFHVRRYVVVVVDGGRATSFLADFGKVIYARAPDTSPPSAASMLTTSQDGWSGPPGAPQTWALLRDDLASRGDDTQALEERIAQTVTQCVAAASPSMHPEHLHRCRLFQLFGVDLLIDRALHPWLLEFNKRPEMRPRGAGDGSAKLELLRSAFRLGLDRPDQGFRRIGDCGL
ncbi:MAG: hypothetical protein AAF721_25290 [Myxococcota bacterium]